MVGQQPIVNKARKSVAGFKIRDGMSIGASVTLRKEQMYTFLTKLIHIVLPRIRDFRGISPNGFDLNRHQATLDKLLIICSAFPIKRS